MNPIPIRVPPKNNHVLSNLTAGKALFIKKTTLNSHIRDLTLSKRFKDDITMNFNLISLFLG